MPLFILYTKTFISFFGHSKRLKLACLICSFQRYMGVWALKMTQLAHYPNFYVKYRTALEVTGVLFISSEKRTRGGSLSYYKTKLFIGRADPLSFWASLDGWWIYFTKCSHSEISWDKPPHALSERWDGTDGKVPVASLLHPPAVWGSKILRLSI